MKNWQVSRYVLGSAQYVVAHGQLQAKKGKNPSVQFMGITNPRLALRAAQNAIKSMKDNDFAHQRSVAEEAMKLDRRWRQDSRKTEYPTVSFHVIHAKDLVHVHGLYRLSVCHINTIHGHGFKPLLEFGSCMTATGDAHLLTANPDAYAKALSEGMGLLKADQARMDADRQMNDLLEFRCHSGRHQIRNRLRLKRIRR